MRKIHCRKNFFILALMLGAGWVGTVAPAAAQTSSCSSDGQKPPSALFERFISADCDSCWVTNTLPGSARQALALDWIVPSAKADEAPLSSAAIQDASRRLQQFKAAEAALASSQQASALQTIAAQQPLSLRVALGQVVSGYVGASLELRGIKASNIDRMEALLGEEPRLFLALIETLPAGEEGSPVARNLVRNVLEPRWNLRQQLSKTKQTNQQADPMMGKAFLEFRPMQVPPSAQNARLRVVGWLENKQGQVVAAAQAVCK